MTWISPLLIVLAALASMFGFHFSAAPIHGSGPIARPYCVLGTGPSGDAPPTDTSTAFPNAASEDLVAFGVTADKTSVSAQFAVLQLGDGPAGDPQVYGTYDAWELDYVTADKVTHFIRAEYGGLNADQSSGTRLPLVSYVYGRIAALPAGGVSAHQIDGSGTGHLDIAHNLITVSAPLASVGLKTGDVLNQPSAITFEGVGNTPVIVNGYQTDKIDEGDGIAYSVGGPCS